MPSPGLRSAPAHPSVVQRLAYADLDQTGGLAQQEARCVLAVGVQPMRSICVAAESMRPTSTVKEGLAVVGQSLILSRKVWMACTEVDATACHLTARSAIKRTYFIILPKLYSLHHPGIFCLFRC